MSEELGPALAALLDARFRDLSKPLRKNLAALTLAFLLKLLARALRGQPLLPASVMINPQRAGP